MGNPARSNVPRFRTYEKVVVPSQALGLFLQDTMRFVILLFICFAGAVYGYDRLQQIPGLVPRGITRTSPKPINTSQYNLHTSLLGEEDSERSTSPKPGAWGTVTVKAGPKEKALAQAWTNRYTAFTEDGHQREGVKKGKMITFEATHPAKIRVGGWPGQGG